MQTEILKEVFEGVNYLHNLDHPIIHRDLKSENIMIKITDENQCVKICDFGLAKKQVIESMYHTQGVGTVGHIAPEVLNGIEYDTKADIYSLAVLIMHLLIYKYAIFMCSPSCFIFFFKNLVCFLEIFHKFCLTFNNFGKLTET